MTSRVAIVLDGSTKLVTVPFPFISKEHVMVALNRVFQYEFMNYQWVSHNQFEFNVTPPQGTVMEVIRSTPTEDALVVFQNGSQLTDEELNMATMQSLYALQEVRDLYQALIDGTLDNLVLESGNNEAGSVIDKVVQTILDSELLKELQERIGDIDENAHTIVATRFDLDDLRTLLGNLDALQGELATIVANETQERIEGDTATAQTIALIGAKSGDSLSFVLDLNKVKVSPTESLGSRFSTIQSNIGDVEALVQSEQTARVTALEAMATQLELLEVRMGESISAQIASEASVRATADGALGTRLDQMLIKVDNNAALIQQETTARVSAVSSVVSSVETLQSKVGANTASIQTQQNVIDGISAQYVVKLDVNGKVAGFGLWNQAGSSQFIVRADKFAIASPTGLGDVVPFAADANGVYINNAYIRNLTVDKITGGAISSQWNLNSTSGRIVLDTGSYMKVIGVGFGAYGDLIEWFGPKMAINQCTKQNAVTYVGMDGSAYFGGSLRAGTYYNAAQTTAIASNAYVDIGPFWTDGRAKTVVVSYSANNTQVSRTMGTGGFSWSGTTPSATVVLYRSINGGGFVEVARGTFTGGYSIANETDGDDVAQAFNSGSFTFTDNTGASNLTYRAQIVSRTDAGFNHPQGIQVSSWTQRVSVVSTEQ